MYVRNDGRVYNDKYIVGQIDITFISTKCYQKLQVNGTFIKTAISIHNKSLQLVSSLMVES